MNANTKRIFRAKDLCRRHFPYLSALVFGMPCRESDKAETLEVDMAGRCYFSAKFVGKLTNEQLAYCLIHECFHLALNHHKRRAAWKPQATKQELLVWNIAADLCIQQSLAKDARQWEPEGIVTPTAKFDDRRRFCDLPGWRAGATTEWYADWLMPLIPAPKPAPFGGSCADGEKRPAERPGGEGVGIDAKLAKVAEAIEQQERTKPGSTPGALKRAIDKRLGRQPDPFRVLTALVARSVASPIGTDNHTYRKLSRRQPVGGCRIRGVERLAPECTVIVDTSGSMSPYIQRATTAVAQGLKRVHKPRVICWDAHAQSDKRLSSLSQFSWDGGGGTSMDRAIEYADKAKSDCIVCITDGETDYPRRPTKARLVIALVQPARGYPVPEWAKVVKCYEGADYDA